MKKNPQQFGQLVAARGFSLITGAHGFSDHLIQFCGENVRRAK
jgi:hypothetical protein